MIKRIIILLFLVIVLTLVSFNVSVAQDAVEWNSQYFRNADNSASVSWVSKPVSKDSVVTKISVSVKGFPMDNKPAGDVCLFIKRPEEPYYYEFMTGGFSELICNHVNRIAQGQQTSSSDWSWEASPNLFVPKGSEISCHSTLWPAILPFPESFGSFDCKVTLDSPAGKTVTRSLRFPYIDQFTKPVSSSTESMSGQSPWVGYKSNNDFPLKVKNADFFVGFPHLIRAGLNFCVYWVKNGGVYQKKCIPYQQQEANLNYDGYRQLLDINWDIPPGDELFAQCTYYGAAGSNSDCAAYVFVELPDDKKTYQGAFTSYDLIDVSKAHDYCYDSFNSESFTGSYFDTDASKKCMDLLRLYDPIEVTLSSDKSQGNIGEAIKLTAQNKRGLNPQYKFWYYDGTNYLMLRDWGAENSFTTTIKNQGVNQYGVHIKDTGRDYGSDYPDIWVVAQSWVSVQGIKCANEGEFCGGIANIQCCSGLLCELEGTYPDAGGKCIKIPSQNNATCGSNTVPLVMRTGEKRDVTMTFNNTGKSTWTKGGTNYYYTAVPPGMTSSFGVPYVALPSDSVPPSGTQSFGSSSATFSFTIVAPSTPGVYQLKYQMAQQGVEFFGEQCGPEKIVVWQPADSLIRDMKEKGCVWSGLITTAEPFDSWIQSKFDEYIDLLDRSACSYLHRSIETWTDPPNSTKIAENIERIRQATGKEYIHEMMIAEAIPAHNSGTWWFNKEYANFNFPAMCSDCQPVDYGRPNNCIPSLNKPEYRRYVKYITEKAIDNGVQSFMFGQVYLQDERWKTAPVIQEVIAEMRAYALSKDKQIVIGAQTNDIDVGDYLRNFDYITSVTAQDENGNIETDRDCHSCCPPGPIYQCLDPIYQCLALLWGDRFRLPAQNNDVAILISLDFGSDVNDEMHKFARMSRESRANFLNSVYSFLKGKDIGFLMPMLVGISPPTGKECYGSSPYIYSSSNQYTCKDEDVINSILLGKPVVICNYENESCGGIAGKQCCSGLKCQLEGNYLDASGECIKEATKNCVDSDNGKDYYTKGTVTLGSESKTDSCTYCTGACPEIGECPKPVCGGVVEYYCSNNIIKSEEHVCSNNCEEGACLQANHCDNGVQDEDEEGIDCGGSCRPCSVEVCNNDGICDLKQEENSEDCPEDCSCGDGICDSLESPKDCPKDCKYCTPEWECRLEPAICPEEGIQNKVCIDTKCGTGEKRKEASRCVPGECTGCLENNKCYSDSTRLDINNIPSYCDVTKEFLKQKDLGAPCQNNYECLSNECSDGECISLKKQLEETRSLLQKILDWLKNIF